MDDSQSTNLSTSNADGDEVMASDNNLPTNTEDEDEPKNICEDSKDNNDTTTKDGIGEEIKAAKEGKEEDSSAALCALKDVPAETTPDCDEKVEKTKAVVNNTSKDTALPMEMEDVVVTNEESAVQDEPMSIDEEKVKADAPTPNKTYPLKQEEEGMKEVVKLPEDTIGANKNTISEASSVKDGTSVSCIMASNVKDGKSVNSDKKQASAIDNVEAVNEEPMSSVRKSQRTKAPSTKFIAHDDTQKSISTTKTTSTKQLSTTPKKPTSTSAPKTPQELHKQIKNSRDKLFFIAYSHNNDPLIVSNNNAKNSENNKKEYQWYLVRVDLSTCKEVDDAKNCQKSGKYYVEFYTKASYDQGILLPGNPLENGVVAAKMKPKPDNDSRYWLEWHEYRFNKNGEMIVGKWKEFQPNIQKAVYQRLMNFIERKRHNSSLLSPGDRGRGDSNTNDLEDSDGEDRLVAEYHPHFDKYTTWADVIDLMDTNTRLVGPFDFDGDTKPPPPQPELLQMFSDDAQRVLLENQSSLYVKDRVPLGRWQELLNAIKGRDIDPPTVVVEEEKKKVKKKKKQPQPSAGDKRPLKEGQGVTQTSRTNDKKKARKEPMKVEVCRECGKGAHEKREEEPLIYFPASESGKDAFYIHASCGRGKSHGLRIVSKYNFLSLVESAFAQTRHAQSRNGHKFFVLDELNDTLNVALERCVGGKEVASSSSLQQFAKDEKQSSSQVELKSSVEVEAKSSEPLEGLSEANFTAEEINSFPVAYSYVADDPNSEENAKIAQLDYEVEARQLKRGSGGGKRGTQSTSVKGTKPSQKKKESLVKEDEFPGWTVKEVQRDRSTHIDRYWYHNELPQGLALRSKAGVKALTDYMKANNVGTLAAYEHYKGEKKYFKRTSPK